MQNNGLFRLRRSYLLNKALSALLVLAVVLSLAPRPALVARAAPAVFINEIHYDNTGTDAGEAIEIAGPAGTDLTGWSVVLYNGSGGAVYDTDALSGTIPDQDNGYGTVSLSYPANGIQNGAPDGIALVDAASAVVQFLSYEGTFTAVGGPADGLTSSNIGVSENGSEPLGQSLQLTGSGTSYSDFTWLGPATATLGAVNTGQSFVVVVNQPVVATCGANLLAAEGFAAVRPVSATDTDGTVINILINSITPMPATGSISLGNLIPAAVAGGTATADITVDALVPPGTYDVQVVATNNDSTPQTGTCNLSVTVQAILPIGSVQGAVGDTDDGATHRSPYAPPSGNGASSQMVTVQGVIFEKTLARTSSGGTQYGFFLQNTAATADSDPHTSDGIFVFQGSFPDLIGGYVPVVGDEVVVLARVTEFFSFTELSSARALVVVRSGVDLDQELPAQEVFPPDNLAEANRYWERREGMRLLVPAGSLAIDGRDVFPGTADAETWLVRGDHSIAQRLDPYDRRSFRDPHPLDNDPLLFDDGNGYRIIIGSLGVKATAGDNSVLLPPNRTFDALTNSLVGGLYFSFSKYQIMVEQQPVFTPGVDPSLNSPPQPFDRTAEFSLAPYNVENLYDYRDDPFDGCDFTGNLGCPGVNPPFDYVPASLAAYQAHLDDIARQIIADLHGPDILLIQEAEDQDICSVSGGALLCGAVDDADGKPDTLQELALAIAALGGPAYEAAYDRDGADDRGIVSGFLYRSDRLALLPAAPGDPVLGSSPTVSYRGAALAYNSDVQNPKALNADLPDDVDLGTGVDGTNVFTRPPQVALFRLWKDSSMTGAYVDLYAVSNHFSSTPDARVGQRTEQALYNAAIVAALQAADPLVKVAVGGDFNVYPRPDDPYTPSSPRYPTDQLGPLYDQGLTNLFDALLAADDDSAYSYVFQGQTQTLDQVFVTPSLQAYLTQARAAHVNADFAADYPGDVARGASDHDPLVARFCRAVTTVAVNPGVLWPPKHQYVTVTLQLTSDSLTQPGATLVSVTSDEPDNGLGDGDKPDDIVILDDLHVNLRAERSGAGQGRIYTLTYLVTDACGLTSTAVVYVVVPHSMARVKELVSVRVQSPGGLLEFMYTDYTELYLPVLVK